MTDNKGWECPKCGACYAPTVTKCETCLGTFVKSAFTIQDPDATKFTGTGGVAPGIDDGAKICGVGRVGFIRPGEGHIDPVNPDILTRLFNTAKERYP